MSKLFAGLTMLTALTTATLPLYAEDNSSFGLGISSPCHGLIAARGVYDFNNYLGVQADIGLVFTSADVRYKKKIFDWMDTYGYLGGITISPWIYPMTSAKSDGPTSGVDLGAGFEIGGKKGLSFGIEGGFIIPIPAEKGTGAFRIDANLMNRF